VYRSKLLSRLLNIKEQVSNFKDGRMMQFALACEFSEHLKYLSSQINLVKENNMYGEDFLVYVIMFDIRHYKHNRKNKMLVKN
jgi:hypothetical protein